jgi:hypothetical protein
MNSHDYIPRSDGKFLEWVKYLFTYVQSHLMNWDINPTAVMPITELITAFEAAYAKAEDPNHGKADVVAKNATRDTLKKATRQFVKGHLTYNLLVTDEDRGHMALPIHDVKPTPVPPPAERPVAEVDFSELQQHSLKVKGITGLKPNNAHGFEVWRVVGDALPTDEAQYQYAGFSTKSPFLMKYTLADRGKTVFYRVHWVNAKNEPGPWSETVSAIIA